MLVFSYLVPAHLGTFRILVALLSHMESTLRAPGLVFNFHSSSEALVLIHNENAEPSGVSTGHSRGKS